ncbi:uncharacterized protein [Anoplolepis gracilipes]|uniref:uncharacterized protein n=1 Tax=Anoplolepis gracilipes TaxID=354296 RepID=UPI003BA15398
MTDVEEFTCEILENEGCRNSFLEKLESSLRNFRLIFAAQVQKRLLYEKDCADKKSIIATKKLELQQKIDTVTSNIDAIMLQKEVTEKKISDVIKLENNLKNGLKDTKMQKDALCLEIMDLELEIEERKRNKLLQWEAIKRVCNIYKENLDIHINLQEEKDCQYIKVTFFTHNKETKDKYFVQLSHSDNNWKIEHIEPKLKKEYFNELSIAEDSSEYSKILDIPLFLYEIRNIFLKYYIRLEKDHKN